MLKNNLSTWNIKRLRFILIIFFFSLAIPTAILIKQSYSQLKWEAFHHYRVQAEELSKRIDVRYKELFEIERSRAFTDYSFFKIAGDINQQALQHSPLSTYPINSKFPGITGYFQIDNNGKFTTPLLPSSAQPFQRQDDRLVVNERIKRQNLHNKLYKILSDNKLVSKRNITSVTNEISSPIIINEKKSKSNEVRLLKPAPSVTGKTYLSDETQKNIAPQAAFDKLQSHSISSMSQESNIYSKSNGRVEDLKLKRQYQKKALKQKRKIEINKLRKEREKYSLRNKNNFSPAPAALAREYKIKLEKRDKTLQVNMFESKINKFELSLLQSGYFVLYREVWKNNLRYIQGLLINPDIFIKTIISDSFYKTNVSSTSNLTIAYQGTILATLNNKESKRSYSSVDAKENSDAQGTLLLQRKLSNTLNKIELIFSIKNLPAGPGGNVIIWLSIILLLILVSGFFILYVLGLKQIKLAQQQQDFVSAVSHELKTPLTSIRMYGEMLREGWTTENKRKQYYDYICDESERLTRLINNVLQLARMTRNEFPVDLQPHTVLELLDIVRSKINSQIDRTEFSLHINCDENISKNTILIDADYFVQIIINLVDNAIKFSNKSDQKRIDIHCNLLHKNKIQFGIRDYGPGVNKDQMNKIFQLFYRTENELTRETVGTGIGLSLVKQLVTSMQGKVDVINKEPGVEFQITF